LAPLARCSVGCGADPVDLGNGHGGVGLPLPQARVGAVVRPPRSYPKRRGAAVVGTV
jgi:hypothetical protein